MSPVDTLGTPRRLASSAAWLPLPAPGGPISNTRLTRAACGAGLASATDPPAARPGEALVVAHDELGLDLRDRVHRNAHDDEQRGAAEVEVQAQPFRDPAQPVL